MTYHPQHKKWIVYVSTFPPRECGIATFTQDLMTTFDDMYNPFEEAKVIALNLDETSRYTYDPKKVIYQIAQPDEKKYIKAAEFLNDLAHVALVNVQHEFGIFGGTYGSHLLLFLRTIKKPVVVTFHTVLPSPNPELRDVVSAINNHTQKIIVMTDISKKILIADYAIDAEKIEVIPHGIHEVNFSDGKKAKRELNLSKRTIISTFGLLNRGKGIEYGIEAMSQVVKQFPDAAYLIIGATHPVVLKNEGEEYRNSLIQKVHDLHLEKHVFFYDKYVSLPELLHFLEATDIYLALSQEPNQAVSGTLSYALGSGKPVVSTPFAQAREDVNESVGLLVDFKNVDEIARALEDLTSDASRRYQMGKSAYFRTRSRTWNNVILRYMAEYMRLVPALGEIEKNMPKIKLSHFLRMTDHVGIFQFAHLTVPDPAFGYTTDDNARALIAMVRYYEKTGRKTALPLIHTYLNFLEYMEIVDHTGAARHSGVSVVGHIAHISGGFHNYADADKRILADQHVKENLESSNARVLFALDKAVGLFKKHMSIGPKMTSPRSVAYVIKAFSIWASAAHDAKVKNECIAIVENLADRLIKMYAENSAPDWRWFEDILAYSNGVLPDALIDAYVLTKKETYLTVARETADFLLGYSFEGDMCVPIGQNGWLRRGGKKHRHDQQPEEVAVLIFTLHSLYRITREEKYQQMMRNAFNWFLGNNSLHQVVYNQATGGCYDGLGETSINLNQGAESTIMYMLARLAFE